MTDLLDRLSAPVAFTPLDGDLWPAAAHDPDAPGAWFSAPDGARYRVAVDAISNGILCSVWRGGALRAVYHVHLRDFAGALATVASLHGK